MHPPGATGDSAAYHASYDGAAIIDGPQEKRRWSLPLTQSQDQADYDPGKQRYASSHEHPGSQGSAGEQSPP